MTHVGLAKEAPVIGASQQINSLQVGEMPVPRKWKKW